MDNKIFASLKSIGAYAPKKILSNKDLESMVDTSDEWIVQRTGIKERRIASDDELTSDLGVMASKLAIKRAGLKTRDIDAVICATLTPDFLCMPATACIIASKLGIKNILAFDVSAACSGFIYILYLAKSLIESGVHKNILIVGAEKLSSVLDYTDRGTCILFGDGAGAAIVGVTTDKREAILDIQISADGDYAHLLMTPRSRATHPKDEKTLEYLQMAGNEVFKVAVKTLTSDVIEILNKNNIKSSQVNHFIPHQANLRIINAVREKLDFPIEKTVLTVHKYGNTSAASIPMAINEAYEDNKIKKGDLLLLDAFGGGFTWGSSLIYFGGE
ncbi:MAG: ketoacyl-ACP synthase III [Campylobacteraceae bacterium]|nr:ketoacyl-ACP synthase III [Campylobacteraceae bacterium]